LINIEPRENSYLQGHENEEEIFINAFHSNRLANSWIICGPKGIGKATLAYRIARYILSETNISGKSLFDLNKSHKESMQIDETDLVFTKIASSSHPDLKVIEPPWTDIHKKKKKKSISVDDIRTLKSFLRLTSAQGGWKVVIIDTADDMTRNAENALLKIIEEPPNKSLIILVSNLIGKLLPTTRSRCQKLVLQELDQETITKLLLKYKPNISEDDLISVSLIAQGSIGRAIEFINTDGMVILNNLFKALSTFPDLKLNLVNSIAENISTNEEYKNFYEILIWWLGRIIASNASSSLSELSPEVVPGEKAIAYRICSASSIDRLLELWEKVNSMFATSEALNIDKKRTIINALMEFENLSNN